MDPSRSLCPHWSEGTSASLRLSRADALAWHDGPTIACVACAVCGAHALLEGLAWRPTDRVRVFGLAGIDAADVALYRRNVDRGSCDLARREQELAALRACAGPVERVIAVEVDEGRVCASAPRDPASPVPDGDWTTRCETKGVPGWFARLGLA